MRWQCPAAVTLRRMREAMETARPWRMKERAAKMLLVPLLFLVNGADLPTVPKDAALSAALRGVWCASEDNGKTCWGYDHFVDEGLVEACGAFPDDGTTFRLKGRYELRGRESCLTVIESNIPKFYPVGHRLCTRVLRIDKRQHTYKNVASGTEHTTYRVPETSKRCPSDA